MRPSLITGLGLGLACFVSLSASAETSPERTRQFFGTLYAGQWVQTDLYTLPVAAVSGKLARAGANFAGVGVNYALLPSFGPPSGLAIDALRGFSIELEGRVLQHFGLQNHGEVAAAIMIRSPQIPLPAGFSMNVAVGEGFSYAMSSPQFEGSVAAEGPNAAGPRKFLNYLPIELELSHASWRAAHLVLAVHHRSGIWGVIAPQKTGANYITGGLRLDF